MAVHGGYAGDFAQLHTGGMEAIVGIAIISKIANLADQHWVARMALKWLWFIHA